MTSPNRHQYVFRPYRLSRVKYRSVECPGPRSGHRIVCDDINIYCFGGYNPALPNSEPESDTWSPSKPLFKELWSYSIANRIWKQHKVLENMPDELASNAMCMYGKYLMIFGGTGYPFGYKCSNDVIVWRKSDNDARLQVLDVRGTRPPGQYGQSVLCHEGQFYAVGGTNGFAYNCDVYRLDLKNGEWEAVFVGTGQDNEPMGRYRHEIARVGNKLYIIGGGTGEWVFELMEVPIFDLETKTWSISEAKPDNSLKEESVPPLPRKCHSAVQVNTPAGVQVFVTGGFDGQMAFDDVWRLDLNTLQWTLMQKTYLPRPLYFHSATVTSAGCMYVFGGIEPQDEVICRNNKMYKMWLCIPKLSEMCWEAFLFFNPDITENSRSTLLNAGLPVQYVDRLLPLQQN